MAYKIKCVYYVLYFILKHKPHINRKRETSRHMCDTADLSSQHRIHGHFTYKYEDKHYNSDPHYSEYENDQFGKRNVCVVYKQNKNYIAASLDTLSNFSSNSLTIPC